MQHTSFTDENVLDGLNKEDIAQLKELLKHPVIVEQTSKQYKGAFLMGLGTIFLGLILCGISASSNNDSAAYVAVYIMGFGFLIILWSKFAAWWNHG
jgi:hypothetical protein